MSIHTISRKVPDTTENTQKEEDEKKREEGRGEEEGGCGGVWES